MRGTMTRGLYPHLVIAWGMLLLNVGGDKGGGLFASWEVVMKAAVMLVIVVLVIWGVLEGSDGLQDWKM